MEKKQKPQLGGRGKAKRELKDSPSTRHGQAYDNGCAWKWHVGLATVSDHVNAYLRVHFLRPGALVPLPEDVIPSEGGAIW